MATSKPKKRKYAKVDNSILFRGRRYWFYVDAFFRGPYVREVVAQLRKEDYKVRLIRPALSYNIIDIYTNPRHPNPRRNFSRLG